MVPRVEECVSRPTDDLKCDGEGAFRRAMELLRCDPSDFDAWSLDRRLAHFQPRLEDAAAGKSSSARRTQPVEPEVARDVLVSVLEARRELMDGELAALIRALSGVRDGVEGLRNLSPQTLIERAPGALSRCLLFGRVLISKIRGPMWLPQEWHIDDVESESSRLRRFVTGATIPLSRAPLEASIVRRRTGIVVQSPSSDRRTFKALIAVAGSAGYIAAPIMIQGRAVGMVHADRPSDGRTVTFDDLAKLEMMVEHLSIAFETSILCARAAKQRAEIAQMCAKMTVALGNTCSPESQSNAEVTPAVGIPRPATSMTAQWKVGALTPRECEVLAQMATGATNGQIAQSLYISEETVKSHLKAISRKLHTSSRAAAVARYGSAPRPIGAAP